MRGSSPVQLLKSSHPEAVFTVSGLTALLSLAAGRGPGSLLVLVTALSGQLFTGWTNDYVDAGLDRRQARHDKPVAERRLPERTDALAALAALAACVPLSFANGLAAGGAHLAAVAAAAAYNFGLKATVLSPLPYAIAFGILPNFVSLGLPAHQLSPWWATGAGVLIGVGGHMTQTLPDIERDRAMGLRGLPHRLGATGCAITAAATLLGAAVLVSIAPARPSPAALAGLIACTFLDVSVALAALSGRRTAAFRLTLASAGLVVAVLLLSGQSLGARN